VSEPTELSTVARPTVDDVVVFIIGALREMNYHVVGVDAETLLGPAGIDLESLAVVELSYRLDDAYRARFSEEDMERLAVMTLGELAVEVTRRSAPAPAYRPPPADRPPPATGRARRRCRRPRSAGRGPRPPRSGPDRARR
jgi:acyl carrier protein